MTNPNTDPPRRSQERMDRVLLVAALAFLIAYALPIIKPSLPKSVVLGCTVVVVAVWALFIIDMALRLIRSNDRRAHLRKDWPAMLAVAVPLLRPAVALVVIGRRNHRFARGRVVLSVLMAATAICGMSALAVLQAEREAPDANITTMADALWWSAVTVSTVGYGDHYPTTGQGRFAALLLMTTGVALVGVISASLASWFVERVSDDAVPPAMEAAQVAAAAPADFPTTADLMAEIRQLQQQVNQLQLARATDPPAE